MKNSLSVFLIFILFIFAGSISAANEYNHLSRLSCPKVLKSCVDVDFLVDQEYLPEGYSSDDLETLFEDYSSSDLQEICKGCCVAESKNSKCINRCISKCRKNFQPERVAQPLLRAVEISDAKFDVPLDVPIDFLRTNMVDSFKVRFTSADEQKIITARKSGISPLLKVSVQNNGPKLVILLNFQTSNLSALNLKPYQVTTENGAEVHKFQIKGVAEKYFVPGAITLFVFVPRAATRTGKFTLTPSLEDLSASSSSSTTGGIISSGGINCRMFQGAAMCEPGSSSSGSGANLDAYVFIDAPNAGTIIYADGVTVSSNNNPITNANGHVTEAMPITPEAGCESQHFHGTLFGVQDTGMCGHGKIQLVRGGLPYIAALSNIIKAEKDTIEKIKEPNYPAALESLGSVNLLELSTPFDAQITMGDIMLSRGQFMKLTQNYSCISDKDTEAKALLEKLKDNTAQLFDEVKVSKLIESALKCKLKMLGLFLKIEKKE